MVVLTFGAEDNMCGICGEIRFDGAPPDMHPTAAMTATMTSRGPDGEGLWRDGATVLGHRRLVVTQTYRDGDDNLDVAIGNLVRWNVAEMMRQASGSLVVLETTGARVARE